MILASASPRRKEILESFGFSLKIVVKNIEEVSDKQNIPDKIKDIAQKKVLAVAEDFPNQYVVGADTVVVVDGVILGKPHSREEAFDMLKKLSGREHKVITAYSFANMEKNIFYSDFDETKVKFKNLTDEEINWYIDTKEPMDKAGAYGVQGKGSCFVENINGDFFSVMGFPLGRFIRRLTEMGIDLKDLEKL